MTIVTPPVKLLRNFEQGECQRFDVQKEKFNELYPPTKEGRCSHNLLCHTKGLNPQKTELKIENIHILSEWGDRVFVNKDDAIKRTDEIVKENINKLRELGFYVDENGYGKEKD